MAHPLAFLTTVVGQKTGHHLKLIQLLMKYREEERREDKEDHKKTIPEPAETIPAELRRRIEIGDREVPLAEAIAALRGGVKDCIGDIILADPALVEFLGIREYGELDKSGLTLYAIPIDRLPEELQPLATRICERISREYRERMVAVNIPAYLAERARRIAYVMGVSLSDVIEEALRIGLDAIERRIPARAT